MKNKPGEKLRNYSDLGKLKIMLPVGLTGFTGYFLSDPRLTAEIFLVSLGIFLQAVSASTLNQIQETDLDRKMRRTANRPLPSGKLTLMDAILFFFFTLFTGTLIILYFGNLYAALLGLFTILWYNGIYTTAKRKTAFAVLPGALTGALPPFIGWIAAGGNFPEKDILFVGFLFFMGQIPHFWLIVLKYGREYEGAGIPSLSSMMSRRKINLLTYLWVIISAISGLFLCYFRVIRSDIPILILLFASLYLVWKFRELVSADGEVFNFRKYFILLNMYFLIILILLIADRIIAISPTS